MAKVEVIKSPVEKVSGNLKQSAWTAAIESLATIALGVLLIVWPDAVIKIIAYIVGIFLVVKGAYQIINYFITKGQSNFFNNGLLSGIISTLVGIVALVMGEEIAGVFRIIIGIWVIYESLIRIDAAIKLHAASVSSWSYILILALIMLIFGIFITFYSGAVVTLIGWTMILVGIIGIIGDIMFIKHVNKVVEFITGSKK